MSLFDSYDLGGLTLKNKIVMSPMTRSRATSDHIPTDIQATYYAQRASAGLIITEGTSPSINGAGYPRIPGVYNEAMVAGWKKVTDAVHEKGGKIFLQIMHTGRVTHPLNLDEGGKVLAPSVVALEQTKMYTDQEGEQPIPAPEAMSAEQVEQAINEYVTASENAVKAGFDGVELHAANGYLMEQFFHPNANKRDDEFGGSVENRSKFILEAAKRVIDKIGKEKVGIRVSPYGVFNEMGPYETVEEDFEYLAGELGKLGLVYIHIVDHSAMGAPEVPVSVKEKIRDAFGGTTIIAGGYDSKDKAEETLNSGLGHLIAFGRPFLSNPDLPKRLETGAEIVQPDMNTFYTPGEQGYTDYPTLEGATA